MLLMGLRERLKARPPAQATVGIRIGTASEVQENERKLVNLLGLIQEAEKRGDANTVAALSAELPQVEAQFNAGFEFVVVKAISADEMEELISEHPPTSVQQAADPRVTFNRTTFYPALLEACVDTEETAQDWAEMMASGEIALGEINALINAAMDLNDRAPTVSLGKGWTPTRS
jgi:hypothetical protein